MLKSLTLGGSCRRLGWLVGLLGLVLAVGCQVAPGPGEPAPVQPILTSVPTQTLTPAPAATATRTRMPIVYVTRTLSPTFSPSDKTADKWCMGVFAYDNKDRRLWLNSPSGLLSPDGEWLASPCGGNEYKTLMVGPVGGDPTWQLVYDKDAIATYKLPGFYYPHRWSLDGQYLYFVPLGGMLTDRDGHALLRLDIKTGEISEILPQLEGDNFYTLALSPDMSQLAYTDQTDSPLKLTIRNLATNLSVHFQLNNEYGVLSKLVWSPENDRLFGLGWKSGEKYGWYGLYTLILYDIGKQTQTAFYPDTAFPLIPFRWNSEQGPVFKFVYPLDPGFYPWFSVEDYQGYDIMYYLMDPETGETKNIRPTELVPPLPDYWN